MTNVPTFAYVDLTCDAAGCPNHALFVAQDLPTAMSEAGNSGWVPTAKRAYCPTHNWLIIGGEPVSCLFSSDLPPYVQAVQGEVPDA